MKPFYPSQEAAGRAIGEARGYYGKKGGWIYKRTARGTERVICHGWASLAVTVFGIVARSYVPGLGYPTPARYLAEAS